MPSATKVSGRLCVRAVAKYGVFPLFSRRVAGLRSCYFVHQAFLVRHRHSLQSLNKHLSGALHQRTVVNSLGARSSNNAQVNAKPAPRREPRPTPDHGLVSAQRATANGHRQGRVGGRDGGDGDDVEQLLNQLGLPADLAAKLRLFGFEDNTRMSQIGRLADESLQLLLDYMVKHGIDVVTAIMVREAMKRRAGTL